MPGAFPADGGPLPGRCDGRAEPLQRYKVGQQQAFEMLVWASQHAHVKLRDIAQALAETGEFDVR